MICPLICSPVLFSYIVLSFLSVIFCLQMQRLAILIRNILEDVANEAVEVVSLHHETLTRLIVSKEGVEVSREAPTSPVVGAYLPAMAVEVTNSDMLRGIRNFIPISEIQAEADLPLLFLDAPQKNKGLYVRSLMLPRWAPVLHQQPVISPTSLPLASNTAAVVVVVTFVSHMMPMRCSHLPLLLPINRAGESVH